jgi:hypothetical protein
MNVVALLAGWVYLAGILASGCATTAPEPEPDIPGRPGVVYLPISRPGTTFDSVRADLLDLMTGTVPHRTIWLRTPQDEIDYEPGRFVVFDTTTVSRDSVVFTAGRNPPFTLLFEDLPGNEIAIKSDSTHVGKPYLVAVPGLAGKFYATDLAAARRFADDLFFLQREAAKKGPGQDSVTPGFEALAASYRAAAAKPPVTEELRRYIVQANALGQQKDYTGALELYGKALAVDPVAYPEAYFNMALLAAQKGRYRPAIGFMKKYLLLVPEAKDARAAQDKIYEWEILMQKR